MDNFRFNKLFLLDIFRCKQLRIRVVSILGPQNSGKSTLLNFMFGCDFSVSDGRCTRGIYGSLIKSNQPELFDYFLILDTEGLQSIEKGDKEYDRKLILFCFAVSNVLIINTKDQLTDDVKTTLEICVDSLSKIDCVRVQQPSVFFVMNQKADPNRKTDEEAINKIITSLTTNGLITQLRLEGNNFETLPTAFFPKITEINDGKEEFRRLSTSPEFTKRVAQFTNNIIEQANQINGDEAFSNIYKWIEFSDKIFETINSYPDLTFFKNISEKSQDKNLQEYLNQKLCTLLSNQVRDNLFLEIESISILSEAEEQIKLKLNQIKVESLNELEDYVKQVSVSDTIKKLKRDFLISMINQVKESWIQTLRIKMRESKMKKVVNAGEGILRDRISFLLKSGVSYTKKEADNEFNKLFDERSSDIRINIDETLGQSDAYFNLIYSMYTSFENKYVPNSETMFHAITHSEFFILDPLMKSNSIYDVKKSLNLKSAILNDFKIINREYFEIVYDACKLNILYALDFIQKYQVQDGNRFWKELESKFNITHKPTNNRYFYLHQIKLDDLIMIDLPPKFYELQNEIQKNKNSLTSKLHEMWKDTKSKANQLLSWLRNRVSYQNEVPYLEEEFSSIVKSFIWNKAILNPSWLHLIFDETKYKARINEVVEEIKIDSEKEIDHELIQTIILKIENVFEDYNKEFGILDLALARDAKFFAHKYVFKNLFQIYATRRIENVENELTIWESKKESLRRFFISQLSPDADKDKENAMQCLRIFNEKLQKKLSQTCIKHIEQKLQEHEEKFSRLKILEQRDLTLTILSPKELLSFVLEPTEFLLDYFKVIWKDFEKSLNNEINNTRSNMLKNFSYLKTSLRKLSESIMKQRLSRETFSANEIFQIKKPFRERDSLQRESSLNSSRSSLFTRNDSLEINNIVHLKGLCASDLIFSILFQNVSKTLFTPQITTSNDLISLQDLEDETTVFELTDSAKENFREIQSQMSSFYNDELKEIINEVKFDMNSISIGFVDIFVQNLLDAIDKFKDDFEAKPIDFETLGFKRDKYFSRVKGCETKCPCCGRLCDAEHYKVKTEIGSSTNRHKCNRGHQFRGMNGCKFEHSNKPSFKMCEAIAGNEYIRHSNKNITWAEFKQLYHKWDFESDSSQALDDWTSRCTYIWSIIGKELCDKHQMTYQKIAKNESDQKAVPIHFILVLDDSGSMSDANKWSHLVESVRIFLELRSKQGSPDLVSIILFSVNATIEVSGSRVYPELIEQLREPCFGGGTNFSAALERCIQIIKQSNHSTHKYAVVFMSDGQASYPTKEIEMIKDNYMNQLLKFWCIGFGNENFDVLKKILLQLYNNIDNFKNPQDASALAEAYKQIHIEVVPENN